MSLKGVCRGLLRAADFIFACVVLTPLSMLWWSGTWLVLDHWLLPHDHSLSNWASLAFGVLVCYAGFFVLPPLRPRFDPGWNWGHVLVSRFFVYFYGTGQLCFWRGVWELMDMYLGTGTFNSALSLGIAEMLLLFLRGLSNNMGPPFFLLQDNRQDFYHTYPRFRSQMENGLCRYAADCGFTVMVMGPCIVIVWRGIWNVSENLILPDNETISCLICLGVGISLAIVLHCVQTPCYWAASHLASRSFLAGLAFEDLIYLLATCSSLMAWRGGVDLLETGLDHLGPKSFVAAHLIGAGGLLLCNAGSNMAVVGCSIDAEHRDGTDVLWPMDYITRIVQRNCAGCIEENTPEDAASIIRGAEDNPTADSMYIGAIRSDQASDVSYQ